MIVDVNVNDMVEKKRKLNAGDEEVIILDAQEYSSNNKSSQGENQGSESLAAAETKEKENTSVSKNGVRRTEEKNVVVFKCMNEESKAEIFPKTMNDKVESGENNVLEIEEDEEDVVQVDDDTGDSNEEEDQTIQAELMAQVIADLDGLSSSRKNELLMAAVNAFGDELMDSHQKIRDDLILEACQLSVAFAHHINRIADLNQKGTSSTPLELSSASSNEDGNDEDEKEDDNETEKDVISA